MPVHRVPGGRTGTVYALRSELDTWLASDRRDAGDAATTAGPATVAQAVAEPVAVVAAVDVGLAPVAKPPRGRALAASLIGLLAVAGTLIGCCQSNGNPSPMVAGILKPFCG